jgi:hypothetical protein
MIDPRMISIFEIRSIAVFCFNYPQARMIRQIIVMIGPAMPAILRIKFQSNVITGTNYYIMLKKKKARIVSNNPRTPENLKKSSIMISAFWLKNQSYNIRNNFESPSQPQIAYKAHKWSSDGKCFPDPMRVSS